MDLLVFGDICIDYFYEVNKLPKKDESAEITKIHRYYGGMGANTAIGAQKLGLKTALVSVIGSDASDYIEYIQNHGIKLEIGAVFGYTTHSMFFKKNDKDFFSFFHKGVAEQMDEIEVDKYTELLEKYTLKYKMLDSILYKFDNVPEDNNSKR